MTVTKKIGINDNLTLLLCLSNDYVYSVFDFVDMTCFWLFIRLKAKTIVLKQMKISSGIGYLKSIHMGPAGHVPCGLTVLLHVL